MESIKSKINIKMRNQFQPVKFVNIHFDEDGTILKKKPLVFNDLQQDRSPTLGLTQ